MIKEVIVVEGKDDTAAIKQAVDADTIETGGSAINRSVISQIRLAKERRGVIVFTDPDHAGERIRNIIRQRVPGCKHAFLPAEAAVHKGKVGVEHASKEAIREALRKVHTEYDGAAAEVTWQDMLEAGMTHHPQAAQRRRAVGTELNIGYANAKQFLKRCQVFAITKAEFDKACRSVLQNIEGEDERRNAHE